MCVYAWVCFVSKCVVSACVCVCVCVCVWGGGGGGGGGGVANTTRNYSVRLGPSIFRLISFSAEAMHIETIQTTVLHTHGK